MLCLLKLYNASSSNLSVPRPAGRVYPPISGFPPEFAAMDSSDYYALLSVSPAASAKEVRSAYIRISRIIHPDRFDPRQQQEDWQQANEMLSRVNAAYSVLKDPEKRAAYDRKMGYTSSSSGVASAAGRSTGSGKNAYSYSPPPDPGPDPRREINAGYAPFVKLPEAIKKRLLERERGILKDHYYVEIERATPHYLKAGSLLLWIVFLFFASAGSEWGAFQLGLYFIINTVSFYFFSRHLLWLLKWHRSVLGSNLYITPLYIIQTHHGMVRWWPVTGIQNIRITNGKGYYTSRTTLNLYYKNEVARFSIAPVQLARNCVQAVYSFQNKVNQAINSLSYDYIRSRNEFGGIASVNPPSDTRMRYAALGIPAVLGLTFFISLFSFNLGNEPYIGNRLISQMLPHNGARIVYIQHEGLAPLELEASPDYHFLVKITDAETNMPVYTVFVRAGDQLHLQMPDGRYHIRYAGGRTWYGPEAYFGRESVYFKEAKAYEFRTDDQELSGYFIALGDEKRLEEDDIIEIPGSMF